MTASLDSLKKGVNILLDNIDYWREAPIWTPESIEKATKSWFKYLGKPPKKK